MARAGSLTLVGLTCGQMEPSGSDGTNPINDALRSSIALACGITPDAVELQPNCDRRAMELVIEFTLSISSASVGLGAVSSLKSSIASGSFAEILASEALKRGETVSVEVMALLTEAAQDAVEGELHALIHWLPSNNCRCFLQSFFPTAMQLMQYICLLYCWTWP